MRALLKEPLLHFTLAAALLFAVFGLWQSRQADIDSTIVVPAAEMERLAALYTAEAGALPRPEDMRGLVADYVRREALAREARRLGLDQHDLVVDRRLEQKMAFMVADLVDVPEPDEATLKAWFETNSRRFETPERVTFEQIYFRDAEDPRIETAAAQLPAVDGDGWKEIGDPFMLQREYGDFPMREVARLFGVEFARSMSELTPGVSWQGPVQSALGVHFIRLARRDEATLPDFSDVRSSVLADWQDETRRQLNEDAIQDIVDQYTVIIGGAE